MGVIPEWLRLRDVNRRTYLGTVGAAVAGGVAGCSGAPGAATDEGDGQSGDSTDGTDASAASVGEWSGGTLSFALPPFQDAEQLEEEYQPVFDWLAEGFDGVDAIDSTTTTSYSAVVESVTNGHSDVANLSPLIYAMAEEEGVHPVAINWSHGAESYHGYIATRAETDIEELADIEGKTVAMVDPLSTSGGMFPRYMLSQAGLDAGDMDTEPADFDIEWAFGHGESLTALEEGHVDAAAYGDFQHPDDEGIVKIAESDPIPFDPIVARPGTPESVREELTERLVNTPEEALADHRVDRFGEVEPGTYDPVREVAAEMGVEIGDLSE